MSIETASELVTAEEFLALPDDGIDRDLIRGVVVEKGRSNMTRRNRKHARSQSRVTYALERWVNEQKNPPGEVHAGEAGCILRGDPDSTVDIDVVFITAEHAARQDDETTMIDGAPLLAVEILSPSDKQEDVGRKVDDYLKYGVNTVWIIDTHFQTVTVHCSGSKPKLFNSDQRLTADDVLPGFDVAVRDLF